MSRKYSVEDLSEMVKNQRIVDYEGIQVLVKPIPEGGDDGDMDPRVYQSMKKLPLMSHFMPKPKKNATVLEKIMPYRNMFNEYKGTQIADEGVETKTAAAVSSDGHEVPLRIYHRTAAGTDLPMMIYYHGGGFFGGSVDVVEQMCKLLVQNLDCVVLNVDYRLCPENHFPAPLDDCIAALNYAYDHARKLGADPEKISVGGDSAGGNLAAAVTLKDRDSGPNRVKLQVLIYPAVNISGRETEFYHGKDESKYHFSKKHAKVEKAVLGLMGSMVDGGNLLNDVYLQGNLPAESIYASPLLDDFHNVPPTLLIFGEHDMLVFEDFAYAKTAAKAGVDLRTIVYRGLGHGFADQIGVQPQAEDVIIEIARMMKDHFSC